MASRDRWLKKRALGDKPVVNLARCTWRQGGAAQEARPEGYHRLEMNEPGQLVCTGEG